MLGELPYLDLEGYWRDELQHYLAFRDILVRIVCSQPEMETFQ